MNHEHKKRPPFRPNTLKDVPRFLLWRAFSPISYIWKLRNEPRRYRKHLIGLGLLGVLLSGKSWITPQITRRIIDVAYPARDFTLFYVLSAIMVGVNLLSAVVESISSYLSIYVNNLIAFKVRMRVFHALHRIPISYVESQQSGMFLERIARDATMTAQMLAGLLPQVISLLLTVIITIIMMLNISPLVTGLVLAGVPLYYIISSILALKLREWQQRVRRKDEQLTTRAIEAIQGVPTARFFGVGEWLKRMYINLLRDKIKIAFGMWRTQLIYGRLSWLVTYGWGVFLTVGGWYLVFKDRLTLGDAVALGMYIPVLLKPAQQALGIYQSLIASSVPAQRVIEILDKARVIGVVSEHGELQISKNIEINNMTFAYPGGDWHLENISMNINCGTTCVVIGSTGSGKTTLLRLLAGMYYKYEGQILVDGLSLKKIEPSTYQKNVALVMAENFFFSGTILENMSIARPHVNEREVQEAAQALRINRWLESMQDGYNTRLGVGGMRLSSGQIQRIAILRALLKRPRLLLLDEITSSMDVESEKNILDGLREMRPAECITVMTTHRLSLTLESWVDHIIVLNDGYIAEQGTPKELYKRGGEYRKLMDLAGLGDLL